MTTAHSSKTFRIIATVNIFSLVSVFLFQALLFPQQASAAALSQAYLRYDRMAAATATNVFVMIKPTTITGVDRVKVTLPNATVSGTCTVNTSNLPTGVTALPSGSSLSCTTSGQTITIGNVSTLTTLTKYGVNIATGVTTGSAGSNTDTVFTHNGASTVETTDVATQYVASGADQVVISATVGSAFTFTLGTNTDSLTTLSTNAVSGSTGVTLTIATNSLNGWTGWVKDSQQGLNSTRTSHTIPTTGTINATPQSVTAGTEGYGLCAAAGIGSPSIDAEYAGTCSTSGTTVGALSGTLQPVASYTSPTANQTVSLKEYAAISSTTQSAADYTDTITVVGAANF